MTNQQRSSGRRGSHIALPLGAIPFIAIAFLPVALSWAESAPTLFSDPIHAMWSWLPDLLPSVAIPLVGAAIVVRHRHPRQSVPLLLFGAILLAIYVALANLVVPILSIVDGPGFPGEPRFELISAITICLTIISAFGWSYLASGLVRARRFEDVGPTGGLVVVAVVAAILPTAILAGMQDVFFVPGFVPLVLGMGGIVAGFVEKLALGYMAVSATKGWLAGEAPARGWLLAAIGTWSLFLGLLVVSVFPVFSDPFSSLDPSWILGAISLLYGVGSVVLLLAFVLALPDVDDITWYDLAELDAEAALGGAALDPFADGDEAAGVQLFELEDRRLDA